MTSFYGQLIQALFVLGGVLALVYIVGRYVNAHSLSSRDSRSLQLVGALQVGPKSRVVLVKLVDIVYVLGVSEQGVSLIDLRSQEELPVDPKAEFQPPTAVKTFLSHFRNRLGDHDEEGRGLDN